MIRLLRASLLAPAAAACLTGTLEPGAGPRLLTVTPDTVRLTIGASAQLTVHVTDTAGIPITTAPLVFTSTDATIVTVSPTGVVSARSPGTTAIVIESAGSAVSVPVETGLGFVALAAGARHTCGLTPLDDLYCWGANVAGQLGVGDRTARDVPTRVPGRWESVVAGAAHTCALDPDGAASCWGEDFDVTPAQVGGGITFRALSAGGAHTCGIVADSTARCWGANHAGQLGDGTFTGRARPAAVAGAPPLAQLSAGASHTCALDAAGRAWCWGANDRGQLAVDTVVTLPMATPRAAATGRTFTTVHAGGTGFSCGRTPGGTVFCWGRGAEGQLGIGATPGALLTPTRVEDALGTPLVFDALGLGWAHACGRLANGHLACWGTSRLGLPGLHFAARPRPVLAGATHPVAGLTHSCAILPDRRAVCWGGGQDGALGFGDRSSSDVPRPVALQLAQPSG